MTPYIQQQLKKLCDNPNWYDDMLISWDKNPRNQREAIYNYLSHVHPGSNKNDYTLYLSDPQAQYNKLLRTQQKLRNKKK